MNNLNKIQSLNLADLDVVELERRLELSRPLRPGSASSTMSLAVRSAAGPMVPKCRPQNRLPNLM